MSGKHGPKGGPVVSVERDVEQKSPAKRLASGILVAEDAVLVPDPPQSLIDQTDGLRVAIAFHPPKGGPERIRVAGVQTLSLEVPGARTSRVAMLRLAAHSRYTVTVPDVTKRNLAEILVRTGGDLWATLRELGYVTTASQDADAEMSVVTTLAGDHTAALATFCTGLCDWLPCCRR